ncbi:hypothetical protein BC827DRAFT_634297 [Russula dissimulans]|nr:hypothetical protein BC827DRAFT_634297 [Russula dissimulans]
MKLISNASRHGSAVKRSKSHGERRERKTSTNASWHGGVVKRSTFNVERAAKSEKDERAGESLEVARERREREI